MELAKIGLKYFLDFLAAVPAQSWYVAGSVIGGSGILIGIVAFVKRHHLKKWAEKLEDYFVQANIIFWAILLGVASFFLTYGTQYGSLFPYLADHVPQITLLATSLYTFSKPIKKWFVDRKASKKHVIDEVQEVLQGQNVPQPVDQPQQQPKPSSDLLR